MKIYGDTKSGNCLKVKWVCDKLALPYSWIDVDTRKGESRTTQFLKMNGAGQVPARVCGGFAGRRRIHRDGRLIGWGAWMTRRRTFGQKPAKQLENLVTLRPAEGWPARWDRSIPDAGGK